MRFINFNYQKTVSTFTIFTSEAFKQLFSHRCGDSSIQRKNGAGGKKTERTSTSTRPNENIASFSDALRYCLLKCVNNAHTHTLLSRACVFSAANMFAPFFFQRHFRAVYIFKLCAWWVKMT